MKKSDEHYPKIGWREWIKLPELGVDKVKAKIDTGARTSSLHAFDLEQYEEDGLEYIKFFIHPIQKNDSFSIQANGKVVEWRNVKNSGGKTTLRPVIITPVCMGNFSWEIEITLINRDEMGFRMLLGR